jgi:hypothetical protein
MVFNILVEKVWALVPVRNVAQLQISMNYSILMQITEAKAYLCNHTEHKIAICPSLP